ncbi:MAG: metal-binding protein [Elainellaceae cyanobacterium]
MPSGRTHDRITWWCLPLVAGFTLVQTHNISLTAVVSAGFLFGGLMLGPDLDIRSIHYRRWGWLRWIWIPYRGSMRHRSPLSHSPITGTALRIIYLLAWVLLASFLTLALVNEAFDVGWTWHDIGHYIDQSVAQNSLGWMALLIGLELGAMSHYIADWSVSTYRRCKRKGWQGLAESLPKSKPSRKSKRRKSTPSRAKSAKKSPQKSSHLRKSVLK